MTLESAIALAAAAHQGQRDKGGQPYILHPLRVMAAMQTDEERIVAVLHDAVEDGPPGVMEKIMALNLPSHVFEALLDISRSIKMDYFGYLEIVKANPLARKVKLADLWDNMNLSRLPKPLSEEDMERHGKYKIAYGILTGAIHG